MRRIVYFFIWLVLLLPFISMSAQHKTKPFEHLSLSANAGTLGAGVQLAAPVNRHFSLRAGVAILKYTHDYDHKGGYSYAEYRTDYVVPLKAKADLVNGMLLLDIFPFHKGKFHLTGGFMMGTSDIIQVTGHAENIDVVIEVGDVQIKPDIYGKAEAILETKGFKPYAGLGFGSSVTKKRVGFKFELGVMFHGKPKVNVIAGEVVERALDNELSNVNKFLKDFNVYPVLNFQLNFRAF